MTEKLNTAYPDASSSPGFLLWRVTNSWQRVIRAALAPLDLTHVQSVLLASLAWMDHATPVTQRDIAQHAGTDPMMTSQVVRSLEGKQLIKRTPHPSDRRAWVLTPTPGGIRLANKANAAVEDADAAYFGVLGDRGTEFPNLLHSLDHTDRQR